MMRLGLVLMLAVALGCGAGASSLRIEYDEAGNVTKRTCDSWGIAFGQSDVSAGERFGEDPQFKEYCGLFGGKLSKQGAKASGGLFGAFGALLGM